MLQGLNHWIPIDHSSITGGLVSALSWFSNSLQRRMIGGCCHCYIHFLASNNLWHFCKPGWFIVCSSMPSQQLFGHLLFFAVIVKCLRIDFVAKNCNMLYSPYYLIVKCYDNLVSIISELISMQRILAVCYQSAWSGNTVSLTSLYKQDKYNSLHLRHFTANRNPAVLFLYQTGKNTLINHP